MTNTSRIAVVLGSTRPGRAGEAVANWVMEQAKDRTGATYELVDLKEFNLVLLDEPTVPGAANRQYEREETRNWGKTIDSYDGFIFVTPEYNHGVPAALKNAVDVIYPEWGNKGIAFVAYGADGGVRAVEHWRVIAANVMMYDVRAQVSLSLFQDWGENGFSPIERRPDELATVFNQLEPLVDALKPLRQG